MANAPQTPPKIPLRKNAPAQSPQPRTKNADRVKKLSAILGRGSKDAVKTAVNNSQKILSTDNKPSIIPKESVSGTALIFVIAIMAFLACLTLGAVSLVNESASNWQSDISKEITIQIRPTPNNKMADILPKAQTLVEKYAGIKSVNILDKDETNRLLEPWLGTGLDLDELPIPRLLIIEIDAENPPNFAAIKEELVATIPGASLDDHRAWVSRLTRMARTTTLTGLSIFLLVLAATVLTVIFATRGAMAGNAHIIEVLHFVGAREPYIARQFQKHFFWLGLKGGALGGAVAIILFAILGLWSDQSFGTAVNAQVSALFGSFSVGLWGYLGAAIVILLVAVLTAATSSWTVIRHMRFLNKTQN
jgi:cell division transport system permease protein